MGKKHFNQDGQDRKFMVLLYPDSENYDFAEVMDSLLGYAEEWSYMLHDKDVESVTENGVETQQKMKPHYHVCIRFKNPRIRAVIANNIGIPKNYIERAKSWKLANEYLIHQNDQDKYQYHFLDVCANFNYAELIGKKKTEVEKVNEIFEYINDFKCYDIVRLTEFARTNPTVWDGFRRNYTIIKDYCFEMSRREEKVDQIYQLQEKIQYYREKCLRLEKIIEKRY